VRIGISLSLTQFRGSAGVSTRLPAPGNISVEVAGSSYEATFDAVMGATAYEWRLDGVGSWTNIGAATSFSDTAAEGSHTVQVRALDGAVAGHIGTSGSFAVGGAPVAFFADFKFVAGSEYAQSGEATKFVLAQPSGGQSHCWYAAVGTATEPTTGIVGSPVMHPTDVTGMEADEAWQTFAQSVVNTGLWSISGFTQQSAPANTVAPTLSATSAANGDTLSIVHGTYSDTVTGYLYRWRDNGTLIGGATSQSYVLSALTTGHTITGEEEALNSVGNSGYTATSNTATVVAAPVWVDFATAAEVNTNSANSGFNALQKNDSSYTTVVASQSGTCTQLRAYVLFPNSGGHWKGSIYDPSGNLLGSGIVTQAGGGSAGYVTVTLSSPPAITSGLAYGVSFVTDGDGQLGLCNSGGDHRIEFSDYAAAPLDPFSGASNVGGSHAFSYKIAA
jgi:hypothetical protein